MSASTQQLYLVSYYKTIIIALLRFISRLLIKRLTVISLKVIIVMKTFANSLFQSETFSSSGF